MSYSRRVLGEEGVSATANQQKTTEGLTLRFDKDILDKIREEAKDKQISLNTLINQIVTQHLDWHAHAAKVGFLAVTRGTVLKMIDKIPEEDIASIGRFVAKKEAKDFIMMLRNEYSITSALEVLETWLKIVGYSYKHEIRGSEHSYIIYHNMSTKWSIYLSELFRAVSEDFGLTRIIFDSGENTLCFKFYISALH